MNKDNKMLDSLLLKQQNIIIKSRIVLRFKSLAYDNRKYSYKN
jgi:hypothetical protein